MMFYVLWKSDSSSKSSAVSFRRSYFKSDLLLPNERDNEDVPFSCEMNDLKATKINATNAERASKLANITELDHESSSPSNGNLN